VIFSEELRDLKKPKAKWFNRFLKKYDLLPQYLCNIRSVFAVVSYGAKNLSHAMTIIGKALRYLSDNNTLPA